MRESLLDGVERADRDVQSEPGSQNPASPVVADEEKNSADDGEEAEKENENGGDVKRLGPKVVQMVDQADEARGNEENRENPDRDGAGLHEDGEV